MTERISAAKSGALEFHAEGAANTKVRELQKQWRGHKLFGSGRAKGLFEWGNEKTRLGGVREGGGEPVKNVHSVLW